MKVIKKNGLDYNITDELYESIMIHNPEILSEDEKMDKEYEQSVDKEIQQKFPNQESQEGPYLKESDIESILKYVIPGIKHNARLQKKRKSLGMDEEVFIDNAINIVRKSLYTWDEDDLEYYNKNKTSELKQFVGYVDDRLDDIKKYQQNKKQSKSEKQNKENDLDKRKRLLFLPSLEEIDEAQERVTPTTIKKLEQIINNIVRKRNLSITYTVNSGPTAIKYDMGYMKGKTTGLYLKSFNTVQNSPYIIARMGFKPLAKQMVWNKMQPETVDIDENEYKRIQQDWIKNHIIPTYSENDVKKAYEQLNNEQSFDNHLVVVDMFKGSLNDMYHAIYNDSLLSSNFSLQPPIISPTGLKELQVYIMPFYDPKFKVLAAVVCLTNSLGLYKVFNQ